MNIALVSLTALCIAIVVSGVSRLNVGLLAMSLAWLIGFYAAGMKVSAIVDGFPLGLATMLFGVTFLFGQAQQTDGILAAGEHQRGPLELRGDFAHDVDGLGFEVLKMVEVVTAHCGCSLKR